jgi:hypothetical protein
VRCADVPLASPDSDGEWSSTVIGFARVVPALKRPMSAADFCNGYACALMLSISYACRVTHPYICKSDMAVWLIGSDTSCSTLARAPPQPQPRMQTPAARRHRCLALSSCQRARPSPALKRTRHCDAASVAPFTNRVQFHPHQSSINLCVETRACTVQPSDSNYYKNSTRRLLTRDPLRPTPCRGIQPWWSAGSRAGTVCIV